MVRKSDPQPYGGIVRDARETMAAGVPRDSRSLSSCSPPNTMFSVSRACKVEGIRNRRFTSPPFATIPWLIFHWTLVLCLLNPSFYRMDSGPSRGYMGITVRVSHIGTHLLHELSIQDNIPEGHHVTFKTWPLRPED